jgi:adenylate cyclase
VVVTASDGLEALELVAAEEPDLILLDVMMPGLDGYGVCAQLRANDDTAVLPVIMVTSSVGQEKKKGIEAGADDFIPKPFNHDGGFAGYLEKPIDVESFPHQVRRFCA